MEAGLSEVSSPSTPGVEVLCVAPVDSPEQNGERVAMFVNQNEMNVIRHQAKAQDPHAGVLLAFSHFGTREK